MLLEGYLHAIVTDKEACLHFQKSTLQGSMLLLYLKAAALWFHTKLGLTIPIICPTSQKFLPPFCDPIVQAFKWGSPQDKWEPYTHQMLCTFHHQAQDMVHQDMTNHLSCFVVVFNWICLSLFTGSRGSEYCQMGACHHSFSHVATDSVAGHMLANPLLSSCWISIFSQTMISSSHLWTVY